MNLKTVYIVAAKRTPIGSFGGKFAGLSATELGAKAIQGAMAAANIAKDQVDAVYMGNVVSANLGQAPARQAAVGAGIDYAARCTTVNKVCASGMKAIALGYQDIVLGDAQVVVSGGMESMSNIPFYASKMRWGAKYGNSDFLDVDMCWWNLFPISGMFVSYKNSTTNVSRVAELKFVIRYSQ